MPQYLIADLPHEQGLVRRAQFGQGTRSAGGGPGQDDYQGYAHCQQCFPTHIIKLRQSGSVLVVFLQILHSFTQFLRRFYY